MEFKDLKFSKDGKPRKFEELSKEELDCLSEQLYQQAKEEFDRNWGFT